MIQSKDVAAAFQRVSETMEKNRDYLVELDQINGDGDLGLSMSAGFRAVAEALKQNTEPDLGTVFMKAAGALNEAAPSSLGTILSFALMGMARELKGSDSADLQSIVSAFDAGVAKIMERAGSKPGEKTVLDSLCPAVAALKNHIEDDSKSAFKAAYEAASRGSEATKAMRSVHGRAAYYGDKSIGVLDGGSVAGKLIFEALYSLHC